MRCLIEQIARLRCYSVQCSTLAFDVIPTPHQPLSNSSKPNAPPSHRLSHLLAIHSIYTVSTVVPTRP